MTRPRYDNPVAPRVLAALRLGPLTPAQMASRMGVDIRAVRAACGSMGDRIERHGNAYRLRVVIPIRPVAVAPRRMLPVVRRDDCMHEPECMMAAAKAWPDHEGGLTCPWECGDYQPAPKRVAPHPSNWMGGEG